MFPYVIGDMPFIQWCYKRRPKSKVAKEISGRGRRKSREKGNELVGNFRFINNLKLFYIYFVLITLLYHFFPILFLPTTFTHTHAFYPLSPTFSYTPFHVTSRCSCAGTAKKCTKKRDARGELLFCSLNLLLFWRSACCRRRRFL